MTTTATIDGVTTIAPHWMAQGLIDAAVEFGAATASIERDYVREGVKALDALTGNLPPMASMQFAIAAAANTLGLKGGAG